MSIINRRKILSEDITDLLDEISVLLEADLSLTQALSLVQQSQEKPKMKTLIKTIQTDVQHGKGLATALSAHPEHIPLFLTDLLTTAEKEQRLPTVLADIVHYRYISEMTEVNLGNRIKQATIYPIILLCTATIIMSIISIFVLPKFAQIFDSFGASLPDLTVIVLKVANWFQAWWWVLAAFFIIFFMLLKYGPQIITSRLHYLGTWFILRLPGLGNSYKMLEIIRILRTWEFMLSQKASLEQALSASTQAVVTPMYKTNIQRILNAIITGTTLDEALRKPNMFPDRINHALLITANSGNKQRFLSKLADRYTQYAIHKLEQNTKLFSLLIGLVVSVVIGTMIIGVYLPIFHMGSIV